MPAGPPGVRRRRRGSILGHDAPAEPAAGPGNLVTTLANFNCNDNPNLINAGALLRIPDEATLRQGVTARTNCN